MISRRTLGVAVIAVLPLVAACGAGRDTTTDKERQTPYVASASAGSLLVTAVVLVPAQAASSGGTSPTPTPSTSESATPSPSESTGSASGAGSAEAYLVMTVVNRGTRPDRLSGAIVQGGAQVTPGDASPSSLTVQPQRVLHFVDPEIGGTGPTLQVSGFSQPIELGTAVQVTFQFENAGSVRIQVPVRGADEYGTTATSTPLPLTGSYPSGSEAPESRPTGG
jgi:copper(I)-binding protein